MKVYLCGGINGLSDMDCKDWREESKHTLSAECIDPMDRDYRGVEEMAVVPIVTGDLADIRACDALLVNASRPSWGTAMEIVYAHQFGKTIIAFTETPRPSPWLLYHCTRVVGSLPEAVRILNESCR